MAVEIGINPITWTNDDMPELGGDIPLETCLAETRQAGYSGTELGGKFPRTSTELGPILQRHGLKLISGWYDGRICEREVDQEFAAIEPHLTLLRDLGCQVVVYADTSRGRHDGIFQPASQRPVLADSEWRDYGRKVTALAERMAAFGVRMAFHHHMGTIVQTDTEIDRLMATTGEAAGLLYDTGHCLFAGGDPAALLERHIARVVHVHCKDARRDVLERSIANDTSFMDAVVNGIFTVPGDGCIDYAPLLRRLADYGYRGWLVVEAEQDPRKAHPLTYASMGHRNLRSMAITAGFQVIDPPQASG
jgi:inosose dehydratase